MHIDKINTATWCWYHTNIWPIIFAYDIIWSMCMLQGVKMIKLQGNLKEQEKILLYYEANWYEGIFQANSGTPGINSATSKCWQQGKEKSILCASNAWQIANHSLNAGKFKASGSETEQLYWSLLAPNHTRVIGFVKSHSATSLVMHSLFCHFRSWTAYFLKCSF